MLYTSKACVTYAKAANKIYALLAYILTTLPKQLKINIK
jgi:hypothetical protein